MLDNLTSQIIYIFIYSVPVLGQISLTSTRYSRRLSSTFLFFFLLTLAIFVGLRWEVGGDWQIYSRFHDSMLSGTSDIEREFVFSLFNRFSSYLSEEFWFHNLLIASLVLSSLFFFLSQTLNPLRALVVGLYPIVFLGLMGFVRQALAIAFILLSWRVFSLNLVLAFAFGLAAILTHTSAFFGVFPLIFSIFISVTWRTRLIILVFLMIFVVLSFEAHLHFILNVKHVLLNYLGEVGTRSKGALPRVLLVLIDLIFFLAFRNKILHPSKASRNLFIISSLYGLAVCAFFSFSPTAVDRTLLYLSPLLMYAYGGYLFNGKLCFTSSVQDIIFMGLVLTKFAAFIVWLFWGLHSHDWLPYRSIFSSNIVFTNSLF